MELKTMNDLRVILAEEIEKLRAGKTDAKTVSAISSTAARIMSSIRMELDYAKSRKETPNIPMLQANPNQIEAPKDDETH